MENFVEILFGIAIGSGIVCILAFIQSKSGAERAPKYRSRMRKACIVSLISLVAAMIGEILLHFR